MDPNRPEHKQAGDDMPSKPSPTNHRKIINDLLDAVQKQKDIMEHLTRDLEFFRKQFKNSLDYDNGDGCYLADTADETIDLRSYGVDIGNGKIEEDTAVDYMAYKGAMDNFQMGFEKTKDEIEKIWSNVDVGKGSLTMQKWMTDSLEKGRKAAAQE